MRKIPQDWLETTFATIEKIRKENSEKLEKSKERHRLAQQENKKHVTFPPLKLPAIIQTSKPPHKKPSTPRFLEVQHFETVDERKKRLVREHEEKCHALAKKIVAQQDNATKKRAATPIRSTLFPKNTRAEEIRQANAQLSLTEKLKRILL